jgi:hypothetical protein
MDKLRYKLIYWLAMGDAILLNVSIFPGALRPKEAGSLFMGNVEARGLQAHSGIEVTDRAPLYKSPRAVMTIDTLKRPVYALDCAFVGPPRPSKQPLDVRYLAFCERLEVALEPRP